MGCVNFYDTGSKVNKNRARINLGEMNENLSVLFRLGKALRFHDAEQFMQQYDTLVEQEGLSDYTVRI